MNDHVMICLATGILLSLVYSRRTGHGSGGLVSAGFIALNLASPQRVICCLAVSVVIWPFLLFCVKRFGLRAREKIGAAMLAAVFIRLAVGRFIQVPWIGMVIPGLIAADMQKDGPLQALAGLISVSVLTALAFPHIFKLWSLVS